MLKLVGMGGTFDHLHEGHKYLLRTAFSVSSEIHIGLTTEEMLSKKEHASKIEDYETRRENLESFISTITTLDRVKILELDNPYGPPINEPEYDGIVVSQETYQGALKINDIRLSKGFDPLIIIVISLLKGENNVKISSMDIREKVK